MKSFLVLMFTFISLGAFASGKFTLQPTLDKKTERVRTVVGFSVYEKIVGPLAYNGWVGYGEGFDDDKASDWFSHKHTLELQATKKFNIGVGYQGIKEEDFRFDDRFFVKGTYQVW